ncbi:ribonuclease P/MRP 25kDa subunit-like S homeolog isoform X1 [Xenopus laevis]|uniref:MGC84124 protein n=2 Tax=Xenopus laevis TaxID=8355 RepID=Q68EX3_XENLA|nr:ribonuclease P/MRP 25kDa subunit-like S homeolog [Xenopus laevis]XP_018097360.1 ribonuclease P/MRP 25kDa subunit-like S homeolog isoform X1 [Xenopus laevis]XP_041431677.1 ribonuclease P/MRP 25kDa subunit-like S homeolog isoform X1 [Xenopus laevis]AAH80077.1 MGC84124 protein [Xenopus laevis]OCT56924.1 hypothetical protein XELAEV_18004230mg [Xenopus laevis]
MENYKKVQVVQLPLAEPITGLAQDIIEMKVQEGSKMRNLLGFAIGKMEGESVRQMLFVGSGRALGKTISCVEIMKRRLQQLHQVTRICFRHTEETWEPIVPDVGLDPLTVRRNCPTICVLLSKDPLDPTQPGYQPPGACDSHWIQELREQETPRRKRWPPGTTRTGGEGRRQSRGTGGRGGAHKKF